MFGYNSATITVLTSAITPRAGSLKLHNPSPTGFVQQGICGGWVDWQERSSLVLRRISLNSLGDSIAEELAITRRNHTLPPDEAAALLDQALAWHR